MDLFVFALCLTLWVLVLASVKDSQFTFFVLLIIQSTLTTSLYSIHFEHFIYLTSLTNLELPGNITYCEVALMSVPRHHLLRHPLTSVRPMFCMCTIYDHSYAFLLLQSPISCFLCLFNTCMYFIYISLSLCCDKNISHIIFVFLMAGPSGLPGSLPGMHC